MGEGKQEQDQGQEQEGVVEDDEMCRMRMEAGLGEEEWRRAVQEARKQVQAELELYKVVEVKRSEEREGRRREVGMRDRNKEQDMREKRGWSRERARKDRYREMEEFEDRERERETALWREREAEERRGGSEGSVERVDREMEALRERVRKRQEEERRGWDTEEESEEEDSCSFSLPPPSLPRPAHIAPAAPLQPSTAPLSSTSLEQRTTRLLSDLSCVLGKIMEAATVCSSMAPRDAADEVIVGRRETEFTARFRRSLYQCRQSLTSCRALHLKAHLARGRRGGPGLPLKLLQLLNSCRVLLASYLHYIPLSGGRVYPAVLAEALQCLEQVFALSSDCGLDTSPLSPLLATLASKSHTSTLASSSHTQPTSANLQLLNSLARRTFGAPQPSPTKPRPSSSAPSPKPRNTALHLARTNLARQRRMEASRKEDSSGVATPRSSQYSWPPPPAALTIPLPAPHSPSPAPSPSLPSPAPKQRPPPSPTPPPSLGGIMSRLHNLEVLAARDQQLAARSRPVEEQKEKPDFRRPDENQDFGLLLNRIEIIKSDFDVVAQKHEKPIGGSRAWGEGAGKRGEQVAAVEYNMGLGRICPQLLGDIVDRVSEEMLQADLAL